MQWAQQWAEQEMYLAQMTPYVPLYPRCPILLYPGPRRELAITESLGNCPDVLALPGYGVTYNCESQLAEFPSQQATL